MIFRRDHLDAMDLDPAVRAALERRAAYGMSQDYHIREATDVAAALARFLGDVAPDLSVQDVRRLGGGASKEQFVFALRNGNGAMRKYVLRMDPGISVIENDRARECDILSAMEDVIPTPRIVWTDPQAAYFGQPAYIMEFVEGVTDAGASPTTNLGISYRDRFAGKRDIIAEQFIDHLVAIQSFDWREKGPSSFAAPHADSRQAARWQVNWWAGVWKQDAVVPCPAMAAAEMWMNANLPETMSEDLVIVHGDYRTGNYLFDAQSGEITAILDWEAAHIGDFHEDLGEAMPMPFGSVEDGQYHVSALMPRAAFLDVYERKSGRKVNPATLAFYEVLACYKCAAISLGSAASVIRSRQNHQDVHLAWLGGVGAMFLREMCDLLEHVA